MKCGEVLQYVGELVALSGHVVTGDLNERAHRPDALLEQLIDTLVNLSVLRSAGDEAQSSRQDGRSNEGSCGVLKHFYQWLLTEYPIA